MVVQCKSEFFVTGKVFLLDIGLLMGDIGLLMGAIVYIRLQQNFTATYVW